jgi:putative polysaccharide biosynthesis protein
MTTATLPNKALLAAPKDAQPPASATMVAVARKYGVSPIRQMREMFSLRYGPGKIALPEYYELGLFDAEMDGNAKRAYVGVEASYDVNAAMSPRDLVGARFFVSDKAVYTPLLRQLGFRTTETQAVASAERLLGKIPTLATPAAVKSFLKQDARYPVFAKPCSATGSYGSALIQGLEGQDIRLANGQAIELETFCKEIFTDYPEGFLFQTALKQHQALTDVAGSAVGTMRVVTVRDEVAPRVLYTVWKLPSANAMSDNFWQKGSMVAEITSEGTLRRCRIGLGLEGQWVDKHPVSGVALPGFRIPHWEGVQDIACKAHALFPEFGIIGWDIAVTDEGATIIESNDNPYHQLYQLSHGRGIRNPDFMPVFDKVKALSTQMLDLRQTMYEKRKKAKK